VLESQSTTTGLPLVEEQRLHELVADAAFREADARRDQIVIVFKHLRSSED
jgi:hypothetical protein